jgi:hypothetical protein
VDSTPSDVIPACWDPRAAAAAAAATAPTAAATQHPSSTSGRHASPPAACTADTQPSTPASDYTSASAAAAGDDAHPDQASCSYPPPERLRGLDPAARQACVVALAAHEHELSVRVSRAGYCCPACCMQLAGSSKVVTTQVLTCHACTHMVDAHASCCIIEGGCPATHNLWKVFHPPSSAPATCTVIAHLSCFCCQASRSCKPIPPTPTPTPP